MAQLPPSTYLGDDQPGESHEDRAARHISYTDASDTMADEMQDDSTSSYDLRSDKKRTEKQISLWE